ncbi:hypothetical protein SAMN05421788_101552 [Filimonas lacunae]|uniref:Uncharacterized protein n=1 Tax=Filimonas lacunae TaxID=477680 RepID=A0A173MNQ4_9BACT|nr:hypothetical protein [Filimonas lacunae]BAV09107.1 hypothetical protein FLA_5155 [Filimonas lacunae]SIS67383.1 hypothetical protein SAMN05421788_101552 [Filimonas lacunae]
MSKPLTVSQRIKAPTPPFFKKLRTIGLLLAAVSSVLAAAPIALPAIAVKVAGYLALTGSVITAVSQTAVSDEFLRSLLGDEQQ